MGLAGEVDAQDMTALYEHFLDPRDDAFRDPERWADVATLGHTGRRYRTEDEIYQAALAADPDASAERRAELRVEAGQKARKNLAFLDATFSVQKSITALHAAIEAQEVRARAVAENTRRALAAETGGNGAGADAVPGAPASGVFAGGVSVVSAAEYRLGTELAASEAEADAWAEHCRAVEDAIWAGNQAALEYLSAKAGYSRVSRHGGAAGRWIDTHDDSRNHDPQLHIHNAILNRVEGTDGTWRMIDAKSMYRCRGAASAMGDRVMEEHLTRALGEFANVTQRVSIGVAEEPGWGLVAGMPVRLLQRQGVLACRTSALTAFAYLLVRQGARTPVDAGASGGPAGGRSRQTPQGLPPPTATNQREEPW